MTPAELYAMALSMPDPRVAHVHRHMSKAQMRAAARAHLMATRASETAYVQTLDGIMGAFTSAFADAVLRHWRPRVKVDAVDDGDGPVPWANVEFHFIKQLPGKVGPAFERMARKLQADTKHTSLVGISPMDLGLHAEIAHARDANIRLVENAGRKYALEVREIFGDPDNYGLSVQALRDMLIARGNVGRSHADLIARDQTLKLAGKINQIRQQNAGITQYRWSGVMDQRERPTHVAQEGVTYSWAVAPNTGHPGQDYQCRCVAIPVIPEFAGI